MGKLAQTRSLSVCCLLHSLARSAGKTELRMLSKSVVVKRCFDEGKGRWLREASGTANSSWEMIRKKIDEIKENSGPLVEKWEC